jgi:hypothetical protein
MAGMAIGLANTTTAQFPYSGSVVASVVFAAVAILETVGPPMVARALFWSGDADDHKPTNEPENVTADAQQAPTVNP